MRTRNFKNQVQTISLATIRNNGLENKVGKCNVLRMQPYLPFLPEDVVRISVPTPDLLKTSLKGWLSSGKFLRNGNRVAKRKWSNTALKSAADIWNCCFGIKNTMRERSMYRTARMPLGRVSGRKTWHAGVA